MAHYAPRSQTRELMQQKAEIARRLLARGLSVKQITAQLNCSATFVERIRAQARAEGPLP